MDLFSSTRRAMLRRAGALSLWPLRGATPTPSGIYEELGVRPVINCMGSFTMIGASRKRPELDAFMAEASRHFVFIEELQEKVGERLAKLVGTESAMVTTGAAGAITLGTCACLTGEDSEKIRQLPDLAGMKSDVLIQKKHRNPFDHAIRNTGVRLVVVETPEQLVNAISGRTAMMYAFATFGEPPATDLIPFEVCVTACKKAGVPIMVDAANLIPPWDNVRRVAAMGTDLICISGGKHMCGPQCSGILAGRRDLIRAALLNSCPNEDALGRPLKVGREEIIGVWKAAERYASLDFKELERNCDAQARWLVTELGRIPGVTSGLAPYEPSRHLPRVIARWDSSIRLTSAECLRLLLDGDPRIAALPDEPQGVRFAMFLGESGDEKLVARRMQEIFARAQTA